MLLEQILNDGGYDRHVAELTEMYRRKRDVFLAALEEHVRRIDPDVSWTRPQGGLFVWMTVPEGLDTSFAGPLYSQCVREGTRLPVSLEGSVQNMAVIDAVFRSGKSGRWEQPQAG